MIVFVARYTGSDEKGDSEKVRGDFLDFAKPKMGRGILTDDESRLEVDVGNVYVEIRYKDPEKPPVREHGVMVLKMGSPEEENEVYRELRGMYERCRFEISNPLQ